MNVRLSAAIFILSGCCDTRPSEYPGEFRNSVFPARGHEQNLHHAFHPYPENSLLKLTIGLLLLSQEVIRSRFLVYCWNL
jgi:hypothetical protein